MRIDWWTIGLQAINFLILVWLLSRVLYRPVRDVIAKRKAEVERALAEARAKAAEAEAARLRYEADRDALARERRDLVAQSNKEAQAEAGRIVDAAHGEAAEIVETAHRAADTEKARALEALKSEIAALAVTLATGLLGRPADPGANVAAIAAVGSYLDGLPETRRDRLRREVAAAGEPVVVCTSKEIGEGERSAWKEAVRGWFGDTVQASFSAEAALLGGALLRLPHAELDLSWARQMHDAEARILGESDEPGARDEPGA